MFAISQDTYSRLVTSIRDGISDLQMLASQSISLEPYREQRLQVQLLALLRDLSGGLHRAIMNSLSCTCSHTLNLELVAHSTDFNWWSVMGSKNKTEDILRHLPLCVAFSSFAAVPQAIDQDARGETWRGLQFCYTPVEDKEIAKAPQFDDILFAAMQPVPERRRSLSQQSSTAISNICAETAAADSAALKECYGFISDTSPLPVRRYMVYSATRIDHITDNRAGISLKDVWDGGDAVPLLTYRGKLWLAVTISSSVLQLYGTPWLSQSFCSSNIIFPRRNNDDRLYDTVFLWKNVEEEQLSLGEPTSPLAARRNPALLSLGFLLVEIFIGRSLAVDGCPTGQRLVRKFREAHILLPRIRRESGNYFSAVSRCLGGELHTAQCDEMQLTEQSYAGVVALLKKELEVL